MRSFNDFTGRPLGEPGMAGRKLPVPTSTAGDKLHAVVMAGLSAIPIVGGPATELFQAVIQPPLEKRRHEWMAKVGEDLQRLEKEGPQD
jgi:hypothetical protein